MSSFKQKLSYLRYLHAISTGGNLSIPQIPSSPICWYRLGLNDFFNHDIEEGQCTDGFLPRTFVTQPKSFKLWLIFKMSYFTCVKRSNRRIMLALSQNNNKCRKIMASIMVIINGFRTGLETSVANNRPTKDSSDPDVLFQSK